MLLHDAYFNITALFSDADTAVTGLKNAESNSRTVQKLVDHSEEFISALTYTDFYIQALFVGIALALAWLMALLIHRRVVLHLERHPPKKIDVEFFTKPLQLLSPVLALIYLSVVKPFAAKFTSTGDLTEAIIALCLAYIMAKLILLIVRNRPMAYFLAFIIMLVAGLRVSGFSPLTIEYLNSMGFAIGKYNISLLNLVQGVAILVVVFWIAGVMSRTLESFLRHSSSLSYSARELSVKFFRILIYFIAIMVTLSALGVDLTAFAVFGGALGVGIGLGLQKITANFVSGITLLLEKSIKIGDLIELGNDTGWVRELNIRYALLELADGREVLIPNEELVSTRVSNWTHSNNAVRVEIKIGLGYDCDPQQVRQIMIESAKAHPACVKTPAPNCFLREYGTSTLNFVLFFWIANAHEGRLGPQSDVMIAILDKLRKAQISIPTVHEVHYLQKNNQEEK
jgi:small-conductance mechanosensitive channel